MLDIQVSVRVSSPEQAGFLKQVRDMLIARPERIDFFKDLLKFAEEGGAELVHDTGENLPDRVMFLEQKFESLLLYPFTSPTTQATSLIQNSFSGWRQKLSKRFV